MKTITKENVSLYVFEDSKAIDLTSNSTTIGNPEELIIADCNSSNAVVHTGVTSPDDWAGGKYMFDGSTWSLNPDYIAPPEPETPSGLE